MSRSFKNFLYFIIPFIFVIASGLTFAQTSPIFSRAPLPGYIPSALGPFYVNPNAFPTSNSYAVASPFDVQTSRGVVSTTIPITVNAAIPRLASSVGAFALKALPYAGLAVALYDVICSTANYCHDATKPSGFAVASAAPSGWTVDQDGFMHAPTSTPATDIDPSTGQHRCHALYDSTVSPGGWQPDDTVPLPECRVKFESYYQGGSPANRNAFAPVGYTWDGGAATTASKTGTVPGDNTLAGSHDSTDADRIALATNPAFNDSSVVQPLAASGEPVPVDVPVISPVMLPSISSEHVNNDANGNPVSTTIRIASQQITPAPVAGDPLRIQIQEQTTETIKDSAGVTISSSTTTTNIAQPAPVSPTQFPDDYNREVTQKSVETTLKHLDNSEGKTLPVYDPAAVGSEVSAETQKSVDSIDEIKSTSSHDAMKALFNFFVWTPPAVACVNPNLNYKGYTFSPDICTPAGYLQQALTFFFALFGAWTIYGIIFRK